eukprot:SAG31_NODE_41176_length_277_cov_0.859551_1_plen_43_part_10
MSIHSKSQFGTGTGTTSGTKGKVLLIDNSTALYRAVSVPVVDY